MAKVNLRFTSYERKLLKIFLSKVFLLIKMKNGDSQTFPLCLNINLIRLLMLCLLLMRKLTGFDLMAVMVNYETTWYKSHGEIWKLIKEQNAVGEIRKMVAMDGHEGPKEIHVQPEFLSWLTDPVKNGAGALFDFGCYGANLMTCLMGNQRPVAVTAIAQTYTPDIYGRVDDEATILVQYPKAQGVIQASWNWPYSRKDFEVYGEKGYAIATGGEGLRVRLPEIGRAH